MRILNATGYSSRGEPSFKAGKVCSAPPLSALPLPSLPPSLPPPPRPPFLSLPAAFWLVIVFFRHHSLPPPIPLLFADALPLLSPPQPMSLFFPLPPLPLFLSLVVMFKTLLRIRDVAVTAVEKKDFCILAIYLCIWQHTVACLFVGPVS